MKRIMLSFGIVLASVTFSMAQDHSHDAPAQAATPPTTLKVENMEFKTEVHDFGTVPEGPAAEYEFVFKNTGRRPEQERL